ncbi:uncharacterized protein [Rutidosis leptorrhynchoides]|uniref:uncharacterized protein n=1 Tax=Rutidosis leptorrhynchoides TaxID=125765 RepID=UPI003A9A54A6
MGFGVGKESKVGWFKGLCRSVKPNFVMLQETKLHTVDLNWVRGLRGNNNCNFIQKEMVRKSGGQLIIWDVDCFDMTNSFIHDHCIGIRVALERGKSDHCPIILKNDVRNFRPKPIKVFDDWLDIEGVEECIKEVWAKEVGGGSRLDCRLRNKLKKAKVTLKSKSSQKFGNLEDEIELFRSMANAFELRAKVGQLNDDERVEWLNVRKEWFQREKIKSNMLKQKARVRWVLEGDENTSEEAYGLELAIEESEIVEAINDYGSEKAPGLDGFNLRFFKKFWDVIKGDVINAISWFWEKGEFSKGCNASFVTLIPKKNDPITLGDYRPISLISSFYKIVAKILSNQLQKVIPRLVGSEQSAFLRERYILDGVLVANETIEYLKSNRKKGLIFKVDFEKAFDSLNWDFLLEVMRCMGFGERWCKWIHAGLKSASISILIDGSPTREFNLGRGVRQGDPLSPFLFILAAEGLNILTKTAVSRGLFNGVEVGRDKVLLLHLQYADDTMFLGEWSKVNALNFNKSCLYGVGVNAGEIESLVRRMGCQADKFPFIYLGLPIGAKMKKVKDWDPVILKIKKRLSEWKMRSMSFGGRLVLLKSVLNSLPLYYFMLFRAPPCVLKILESVRRSQIEGLNIPFLSSFKRSIGDGSSTEFWNEVWCGSESFKNMFPRLYRLETNKNIVIFGRIKQWQQHDMGSGQSSGNSGPTGQHHFREQAISLGDYSEAEGEGDSAGQSNITRHSREGQPCGGLDNSGSSLIRFEWEWSREPTGRTAGSGSHSAQETLRNNLMPKKIEDFIWRVLEKILPVRIELDKKGIDLHSIRCPICDDGLESIDHALFECKFSSDVWTRVLKWWNSNTNINSPDLLRGKSSHNMSSLGSKIWQAVEWICAYFDMEES